MSGLPKASVDERAMTVLSRSKNAASMTRIVVPEPGARAPIVCKDWRPYGGDRGHGAAQSLPGWGGGSCRHRPRRRRRRDIWVPRTERRRKEHDHSHAHDVASTDGG